LGATLLAGCWPSFPENLLRVDAAVNDLGEVDAGDNDAAVDATVSETGADVPVDRGTSDGPPGDALDAGADDAGDGGDTDASDAAADSATDAGRDVYTFPPDADVCAMFPLPDGVPNARVLSDLDGAIDLAFDPNGRVAVAFPDRVVLYGPGSASTPVVSSLVGEPVAVRYTRQGTLVVAYNVVATPDAGVSDGSTAAPTAAPTRARASSVVSACWSPAAARSPTCPSPTPGASAASPSIAKTASGTPSLPAVV
jgi:hypothetical protein